MSPRDCGGIPVRRLSAPNTAEVAEKNRGTAVEKLTHAELARAHERKDWPLLWQQAEPLVRMVVRRLSRAASAKENVDSEDLVQEGMVIAGTAMRRWQPLECAFSTYIANQVGWGLLNHRGITRNHGIGSRAQRPAILSLEDTRDTAEAPGSRLAVDFEDDEEENTFEAALTYEGVRRRSTGQYDGMGVAPEGFGDPAEEAERLEREAALERAVLGRLTDIEQVIVRAVYGFGGNIKHCTTRELSTLLGIPLRSVERHLKNARTVLAEILPNPQHRKYGSKK